MTFYGGEARSPDHKPDYFGYTIDKEDLDVPDQDDKEQADKSEIE